jgi:hypothetical protein
MLENKLSRVGVGVAGLIENKSKPSSWGLAEIGNISIPIISIGLSYIGFVLASGIKVSLQNLVE